jgi:hypothetical protein
MPLADGSTPAPGSPKVMPKADAGRPNLPVAVAADHRQTGNATAVQGKAGLDVGKNGDRGDSQQSGTDSSKQEAAVDPTAQGLQSSQHPQDSGANVAAMPSTTPDATAAHISITPAVTQAVAQGSLATSSNRIDADVAGARSSYEIPPAGSSGIDSAKLIQTMNESEMRVGLHSAEFGSIAIRTSIAQQQILSRISLEHGDLGQAIATHVSALETKLGSEHGLQARIEVHGQADMFSGDSQNSSHREQRQPSQAARIPGGVDAMDTDSVAPTAIQSHTGLGYQLGYQLDVRA